MKRVLLLTCAMMCAIITYAYNNTYAIIIGVADYKNYTLATGDLRYTTNDARLFYEFLRSREGGYVPAQNIVYLTNAHASKANIIAKGKALFAKARQNDRVIFFFSGHGDKGCFVPYDAGLYGENLLYFSEVKSIFRKAQCGTKLLFADACFSGSMKGVKNTKNQQTLEKEAKAASKMNIAVMMSCKGTETSLELGDLQQGIFTYYLIHGLGGLANEDNNKYVTIKELFQYVNRKTRAKAASMGCSQTPELFGKFDLRLIVAKK
jgi:uncharacterized caspase-like protein